MHPKTLHLHSSGRQVRALQLLLRKYEPQLAVDGKFGPRTERAVRAAQRKLGLFPADGLAGPHTLAALAKAAKPSGAPSRPTPPATPGWGASLGAMAGKAGSAVATAGHDALNTVEEAVKAVERWIAGLTSHATPVLPVLHHLVPPAKAKAQQTPMPPGVVADPKNMFLSEPGRQFIFRHEAGNGHATAHLHHPGGHSGVTIGPGYDMRKRTPDEVTAALVKIGVDPTTAAAAAKGAGKHDKEADDFVHNNKSLLDLSIGQQIALQNHYKAHYEQMVRDAVRVPLYKYEFDALVSFAGNPGTSLYWQTAARLVNEHKRPAAAAEFFKAIHTRNPKLVQGLINRRTAESKLFLYGDYAA